MLGQFLEIPKENYREKIETIVQFIRMATKLLKFYANKILDSTDDELKSGTGIASKVKYTLIKKILR